MAAGCRFLNTPPTKLIFRTPDSYTAKRMSEFFGEQEVMESQESISFGAHQMRDGVSLSGQKRKQPLVSYTQIMQLPNLSAYLQLPQDFPVTKVAFKYLNLPVNQSAFVERDYAEVAEATNVVEVNFPKAELTDIENTTKIADPNTKSEDVDAKKEVSVQSA